MKVLSVWGLRQPPSGGCELKHSHNVGAAQSRYAATFGWL
ncbi:hypothetical protein F543_9140 [Bibersteinia trehalosi USDA-ARS-USMARC-189]|uniref:Uncharacterized protein n=1 Tax=Bibersteinia trehalosi USDA-ARS-USMARC-189 TaxID=1263831 RepID=A0ABM5PCM2_BIBTR|nr:hypothetical protein F543_9140 [Bibersteinia trehalosi USDA-ARS-USMARC-189]